ncbi:FAD-dependent oxidoreductase [Thalassococcus lentus]|uniref:FAD-dependent oxidoreductase n=1 Tax=Thalassococcus lentus TaxID=1210524 RepID=A0ABT4XR91_9RHOB|nr:FAD-dependent oxidoreductase [Thalassococcus lentus]MDA7424476.1 FAD-dependent oxidoreductase [Thalassococcus lentus]
MPTKTPHIAIIGAGLQGSLCALALAERGARIALFDAADAPMSRASLWNEGKIHLGYIFANDAPDRTARLMARGSGAFSQVIARYAKVKDLHQNLSAPFVYRVMPDSLLTPAQLKMRYAAIDNEVSAHCQDYLGLGPIAPARIVAEGEGQSLHGAVALFQTQERSIDPNYLARIIRAALRDHPGISLHCSTTIEALLPKAGAAPELRLTDQRIEGPFDHVINASWTDLLRLDADIIPSPQRPWLFRRKVAHFVETDEPLPEIQSTTMVLGPYGDVVSFDGGRRFYLSWYPVGCFAQTNALRPPDDWNTPLAPPKAEMHFENALHELSQRVPGMTKLKHANRQHRSEAGAIFSWGSGTVDQADSELHQRFDVGPMSPTPYYHRVDTGKLTLAPLFAEILADRLIPR